MEHVASNIPSAEPARDRVLEWFHSLEIPTQQEFLASLHDLHPLYAIVLLGAGLICLLQGWKLFRVIVIVNAAILGTLVGSVLGAKLQGQYMPLFGGIAGAILLGVLAWPCMKYAVSLMGGLAGSLVGYGVWHYAATALGRPDVAGYAWAGALIGLIALGLLAFVIFRLVVEVFTALQGALMTVSGILAVLMNWDRLSEPLDRALSENVHLFPLLILVPATIGLAIQEAAAARKRKKKSSAGGE